MILIDFEMLIGHHLVLFLKPGRQGQKSRGLAVAFVAEDLKVRVVDNGFDRVRQDGEGDPLVVGDGPKGVALIAEGVKRKVRVGHVG